MKKTRKQLFAEMVDDIEKRLNTFGLDKTDCKIIDRELGLRRLGPDAIETIRPYDTKRFR